MDSLNAVYKIGIRDRKMNVEKCFPSSKLEPSTDEGANKSFQLSDKYL